MNNKKAMPFIVAIIFIVIILSICVLTNWIEKNKPSENKADLWNYFSFYENPEEPTKLSMSKKDEVALIVDNERTDSRGILIDTIVYLPLDFVQKSLNNRFYWDENENLLLYTTPSEIIRAEVGSNDYSIGKNKLSLEHAVVKTEGKEVYIAIDYVQLYSNIDYTLFSDPNHMQIITVWGTKEVVDVKEDDAIRLEDSIKSDILKQVAMGETLFIIEKLNGWLKVRTADGLIGYIRQKSIQKTREEVYDRVFEQPEYTNIKKDYVINMVWHQVTNAEGNNKLSNAIANAKGVNIISPTWFTLSDNEGNIKSIASSSYVNLAHLMGIEVWALVDNFSNPVSTKEILSFTSKRDRLINQLISAAIEYDLDGINIDFEAIPDTAGEDFIQFIRELSTKCRLNGIVLSIDNYVPGYTSYYNRKEQGIVADYVIIMGYDEHTTSSLKSGSVASIGFVRKGIEDTLQEVPAEKVINAIPFYTRIWKETPKSEEQIAAEEATEEFIPYTLSSETLGMGSIDNTISANNAEPIWDESAGQFYIEYVKGNVTHKSWLEEEKSIEEKLNLMKEFKLAGVAAWKLGLEKSSIWDTIIKYTN